MSGLDNSRKRILLLIVIAFVLFANAFIVEAAAKDSIKSAVGSMKTFALSGAFWINAFIIFGVLYIANTLLFKDKYGSGNFNKIVMLVIIGLIAMAVSSKVTDDAGKPMYIWDKQTAQDAVQFFLGPSAANAQASCSSQPSFWMSIAGVEPNPPCCGSGAYFVNVKNEKSCKQAILRTNDDGSGLPAFIIAAILIILLFKFYGKNLNLDSGTGIGKWTPFILSIILGALIANQRVRQQSIVIVAGWVAVFLIGNKLSKTLSDDPKATPKKAFGFALAFALVQLIANMLGTSLFGGEVSGSEIDTGLIIKNLLIGAVVGIVYSMLTGGKGFIADWFKSLSDKKKKDIEKYKSEDKWGKALVRGLPGIGWFFRVKPNAAALRQRQQEINRLQRQLNNVVRHQRNILTNPAPTAIDANILHILAEQQRVLTDQLNAARNAPAAA